MSITITTNGGPTINMNNGNAAQILGLLGLPFDGDWGEASAQDFLGRVLIAIALVDTASTDRHGTFDASNGRWVDCGRHPGYLAGRLAELHQLAEQAATNNTPITWG